MAGSLERVMRKELGLYSDIELAKHIVNPDRLKRSMNVKDLLVVKLAIGAPLTAVVAEELFAIGVKEIVIMGISGAINRKLQFGDIVICNKAIRDEGTSHHYLKNSV
ncbi:uridine phosphorylase, partial [mine drainage metagenome]